MKRVLTASSALALSAGLASAGGLDRTGLPIDIIFQDGNYAELSFSSTNPDLSGNGTGTVPATALDALMPGVSGTSYDGVGGDFTSLGLGLKFQINEKLSASVIFEQPFGSDITYNGGALDTELGGTSAIADTDMISAILRYQFSERFSAHGGLRIARSGGNIDLRGRSYGPTPEIVGAFAPGTPFGAAGVNGYSIELEDDTAVGYVLGVAYEIPDIALRVALTYNSEINHKFDTKESYAGVDIGTSTTEVTLPQSIALDVQTGVAPGTLVFGQIRWAEWSEFRIDPKLFTEATGSGLVDLNDVTTYTLGVGRQFTDAFSASFSIAYEEADSDDLVSPLAPSNGLWAYSLGGRYAFDNGLTLSGGIRYSDIGDARPETGTPDTARAEFSGNSALSLGFKVGFTF